MSYLLIWVHLLGHRVLERESRRLVMLRIYLTPDALWTTASDVKRLFEGYSLELVLILRYLRYLPLITSNCLM